MKFYDTNVLLNNLDMVMDEERFYISSITFNELEGIKDDRNKAENIRYSARIASKYLKKNRDKYESIQYRPSWDSSFVYEKDIPMTNDSKIIACAHYLFKTRHEDIEFLTYDTCCANVAESVGLKVSLLDEDYLEFYNGYIEKEMTIEEQADFYSYFLHNNINSYGLKTNEYFIITEEGSIIDKYMWDGAEYQKINFMKTESKMFGKVVPKDSYQALALHSLRHNKITILEGPAGSGKSLLSLGYLWEQLEKGKIDNITIICNTVATKGAAKLGFYPGSKDEKLLDSQIGNFLISKLGGREYVEELVGKGILNLIPLADIRGYDTTDKHSAVYITEAQNYDIEMLKLALQRIGDDTQCILDGDSNAQVDCVEYSGMNNGLRRASEVFRDERCEGKVTLKNIYRGEIAQIAERM